MKQVSYADLNEMSKIATEVYNEMFKPKSNNDFNMKLLKLKEKHKKILSKINHRLAR